MPGMDGIELGRTIRAIPSFRRLPMVLLRPATAMVNDIKKKIDLARLAVAIKHLDLGGMDLNAARETALLAKQAIDDGVAGYVLLGAKKAA